MNRRRFLKYAGATAIAIGASAVGLESFTNLQNTKLTAPVTVTTTNTVTETVTSTNVVTPAFAASLRAAAESSGLLVGASASPGPDIDYGGGGLSDKDYAATLSREFNFLTPENAMKWKDIGTSAYAPADELVNFALGHNMKVKGGPLVWDKSLPSWINDDMSTQDLRTALQNHVQGEISYYRGKVYAWDVVNEIMAWNGLRDTLFLDKLGEGYIAEAFNLAHEADPDAILIYNESGAEGLNSKSDRVYALARKLLAESVPIHGVGLQMHISATDYPPPSDIGANVRRLTALGLKVNISEMDVRIHDVPGTMDQKLDVQRRVYHDVIAACMKISGFMGVTFWGFTDAHSWITNGDSGWDPNDAPLIFDTHYNPKPAYWGVMQALLGG